MHVSSPSHHVEPASATPLLTARKVGGDRIPSIAARVRTTMLGMWAAITGAAPHALHHVGPLAGTALVAGAAGRALFALAGFVATIPMLRRLRRHTGSWLLPGLALAAFAAVYTASTLFVDPAIGVATSPDTATTPSAQVEVGHDVTG
jgi:peptidoglycan/LPS O-acetylase OafA/YrhL